MGTEFHSLEEVWKTLSIKQITKPQFDNLAETLSLSKNHLEYGHVPSFISYSAPEPKTVKKLK